ncbi:hypothetical protein NDU88_004163 [Pleurodeles waltl]|uniref:Uncharacterized protein n=1 Tax=Pleurodeles waltl TaxID=8319 RepID=A0AAV7MVP0_PLEWA|nr:hypothetical protein NDU88_004163 [Pleurodeles waltl]
MRSPSALTGPYIYQFQRSRALAPAAKKFSAAPQRSGLSEEVAWADAAASDPEAAARTSNPRALLGRTEQRQEVRAPGFLKGGETPAEGSAEEGVMEAEDERRQQRAVIIPKSSSGWRRTGRAPEESTAPAAAQEAHCEVSSHASGEAWLTQVRP